MPTTGYIVMIDPSGRASCKGACKQKIEKGELRFGSISTASWDGEQTHFRKMGCITTKVAQNALAFYGGNITKLRGWDELPLDKQKEVRSTFESLISAPEKPKQEKAKLTKKVKADDDGEDAPKKKVKTVAVAMPGDDD